MVHSQGQETEEPSRELEQDLMSLVTVFVEKKLENAQQRTKGEESEKLRKKRKKNSSTKKPSNKPPAGKAIRYHLYPTSDQKQLLQQWFGVARWTYNKCLDIIKKSKQEEEQEATKNTLPE
jgi:hypothetical protein